MLYSNRQRYITCYCTQILQYTNKYNKTNTVYNMRYPPSERNKYLRKMMLKKLDNHLYCH